MKSPNRELWRWHMRTCMTPPSSYTAAEFTNKSCGNSFERTRLHPCRWCESNGDQNQSKEKKLFVEQNLKDTLSRPALRDQTGCDQGGSAIHPLAHDSAGGFEPPAAAPVRGWPGNYAGARSSEKRLHRSRAQPSQRAAHLHPRWRTEVLDRRQRNHRSCRRSSLHSCQYAAQSRGS